MKTLLTMLIIILSVCSPLHSQMDDNMKVDSIDYLSTDNGNLRSELSIGIGFFDFVNLGFKYGDRVVVGLDVGIVDPSSNEDRLKLLSVSPSIIYHFGGNSLFSDQKPWYTKNGLILMNFRPIERYLYLSSRIGRKIFFGKRSFNNSAGRAGINIEAGIYVLLWDNWEGFDLNIPVWPGAGITFFYKL